MELAVKNMVCDRCIKVVKEDLDKLGIPFIDVVAAADDTKMAGQVGLLRADRWQGDTIFQVCHVRSASKDIR